VKTRRRVVTHLKREAYPPSGEVAPSELAALKGSSDIAPALRDEHIRHRLYQSFISRARTDVAVATVKPGQVFHVSAGMVVS
jgi:hypothetical protein